MKKKKDIVERILDYIGNTANKAAKKNAKDEARRQLLKENPEMAKKLEEYDKNLEESFKKTQPLIYTYYNQTRNLLICTGLIGPRRNCFSRVPQIFY